MRIRVKICGVTSPGDARLAAELGADAIGINFFPASPRCVSPHLAIEIAAVLPPFVEPVGLFVKEPMERILEQAARHAWLKTVQWHGDEFPELPDSPLRFIIAAPVRDAPSLQRLQRYLDCARRLPAAVLVDAHVAGKYGGTGQTAPWELLRDFRAPVPLILAGGLTPDNVAQALEVVTPYAVDVASGVESSPGRKDADRLRRFISAVQSHARS